MRESAVTISTPSRLSMERPAFLVSQPMPPPSVNPAMPVWLMKPPGVARPCSCVAASSSPQVVPPPADTTLRSGSTVTVVSRLRSIISPPSHTAWPA